MDNDYLKGGYFDENGLKTTLLTKTANDMAWHISNEKTTSNQIRKFFGHLRRAERLYDAKHDERQFVNMIKQLKAYSDYAYSRDKSIKKIFHMFIKINVSKCNSAKDIKKGFIPHFEAVVGFTSYYLKLNEDKRNNNKNRR